MRRSMETVCLTVNVYDREDLQIILTGHPALNVNEDKLDNVFEALRVPQIAGKR